MGFVRPLGGTLYVDMDPSCRIDAIIAGGTAPQCFPTLPADARHHPQRRAWICPPPGEQPIASQPPQQGQRQIHADVGLPRLGTNSLALEGRGHLAFGPRQRSEEHTSELQALAYLVCRLLLV